MSAFSIDNRGLNDTDAARLQAVYDVLRAEFNIQRTGDIDFHLEEFDLFKNHHHVSVRSSYVIKNDCSDCYILFIESNTTKAAGKGKLTTLNEHQVWGLAYLKQDFGRVKIRTETLVDKIGELLHPIELDFKEDKAFSDTFFVLVNDRDKAVAAIDRHFRNAVMDIRGEDFTIEIVNHTLVIGSRKPITAERAIYMAEFINRLVAD